MTTTIPSPAKIRRSDPKSSREAAKTVDTLTSTIKILNMLASRNYRHKWSDQWAIAGAIGLQYGSVTPRMKYLRLGGFVDSIQETGFNTHMQMKTRRKVFHYRVNSKGDALLRELVSKSYVV